MLMHRQLFTVSCSLFACMVLLSCTIDAYEKGEGEYSRLTAEFVEAAVNSDKQVNEVETDEGVHLAMQTPITAKWIETADTTYRAVLYYNMNADGKAEGVSLSRVGVLIPSSTKKLKEGMRTDPLYVESIWLSKNRRYLNLRLRLLTGSTDEEDAHHTLGLFIDSIGSSATNSHMQFYHDQGGRPEYYSTVTYASIPLARIPADTLTLTVNTYDGTLERLIPLR